MIHLSELELRRISSLILSDIENGTYKDFKKLESRLKYIESKIQRVIHVVNAKQLTFGEIKTLIENGYLN